MNQSYQPRFMVEIKNGKKIVTILLALSCIVSGIILAATPPYKSYKIENVQQLDSLLKVHIQNARINKNQIRTSNILVDTVFTRKDYRIKVPSRFSKTLFHIGLHKDLTRYGIESPAKIYFPSYDMDIFVYHNETILRKIRLTTDVALDTLITREIE
ncbi:MAG: hypothetical protein WD022_01075 [Balneolaceae bacterium]